MTWPVQDVVAGVVAIILTLGAVYAQIASLDLSDAYIGFMGLALGWVFKSGLISATAKQP